MFGLKDFSNTFHSVASLMDQWIPLKLRSILFLLVGVATSIAYYQSGDVLWFVIALFGFIATIATKETWMVESILSKPQCLTNIGQQLKGRDNDLNKLVSVLSKHRLVFLIGQSGSGRSYLVRLGLMPVLARDAEILPLYIEDWGIDSDWVRGPQAAVAAALFNALNEDERIRCGIDTQTRPGEILDVLELVKTTVGREPVLLFNRVDDYQTQQRGRFIKRGRIISRKKLLKSNPFWKEISHLLNNEKIRCLFIARDITSPVLESFRFQKPVIRILDPLESRYVKQLIDEVMQNCIRKPKCGWLQLKDRLVSDMETDGRVLPIQVKRVLQSLEVLRSLTIENYERVGQLAGLQAESMKKQIKQSAAKFGWRYSDVLMLLRKLIEQSSSKTIAKTPTQLLDDLPRLRQYEDTLVELMHDLASQSSEIVREVVLAETGESAWRLDHDYSCDIITELDRKQRRWQAFYNDAVDRFEDSIGVWRRFFSLLTPRQQVRLFIEHLRGKLSYGTRAYYANLSAMRLVLNAWVLLSVFLLFGLIHQLDRIEYAKAADLFSEFTFSKSIKISEDEKYSLWRLSNASSDVKQKFVEQTIASGSNADRFLLHADRIGVAVLGLSIDSRETIVRNLLQRMCYDESPGDFRRVRACLVWIMMAESNPLRIANFITQEMEQDHRSWRELVELAGALNGQQVESVPSDLIDRGAERLVMAMEQDGRSAEELGALTEALGGLGGQVSQDLIVRGAKRLVVAMERDGRAWWELKTLARALGKVGDRVPQDLINRGAEGLVVGIEQNDGPAVETLLLATALGGLGDQVSPDRVGGFIERLTATMERGDHSAEELGAFARALVGLDGHVSKDFVARESERLVVAAEHILQSEEAFGSLAELLDRMSDRVSPDQAWALAEQLVKAIQQDDRSWPERVTFARVLVRLSDRVSPDQAWVLAERITDAMERNSYTLEELSAFAEVLAVLGDRGSSDQVKRELAERLTLTMEQDGRSTEGLGAIARALGGLGESVPEELISRGSERLVVAMEQDNRSLRVLGSLARALDGLGERVPREFISRGSEQIVMAMEQEGRSRWDLEMLTGVLGWLGKRAPADRVKEYAERLVAAMEQEGRCSEELGALARGVGALSEVLSPAQRAQALNYTETKIKPLANPPCEVIGELVVDENKLSTILDVLKWPTCSLRARNELINRVNKIMRWSMTTEQSTQPDMWRFLHNAGRWVVRHENYTLEASVPLPNGMSKDAQSMWHYIRARFKIISHF